MRGYNTNTYRKPEPLTYVRFEVLRPITEPLIYITRTTNTNPLVYRTTNVYKNIKLLMYIINQNYFYLQNSLNRSSNLYKVQEPPIPTFNQNHLSQH